MLQKNKAISKFLVALILMSFIFILNTQKVLAYDYNTVLSDLESLENLAEEYKSEYEVWTDTKILVTSYIRDGVYDSTWNQYGTAVDTGFANYVNEKNSSLSYLKSVFTMTTSSGDTIDFKRLVSDLDIMYTKGSLFGSWVSDIYDLATVISTSQNSADNIASSYYNSFSSSGCLTNIDAFNIYKSGNGSVSGAIRNYYSSVSSSSRYKQFTNNIGVSNITKDALRTSVLTNFRNCSEITNLLGIRGISYDSNKNVVEGACFAFADYIFEKHPEKQYNTSIKISEKDFSMTIGEEAELTINIEPATDINLINVTSSSPDVVSVVNNNTIRAISSGEATITCSYQGASASIKVTVISKIESISFKDTKITVQAGTADKIEPIVTPAGNIKYSFKSSDTTVVDVDQSGNLYSLKSGTAIITCFSNDNQDIKAEMEVTVIESIQTLSISEPQISLRKGESRKVGLVVEPTNYTDKIIYNSSDNQIASIDANGMITARKEGTVTITCTAESNTELTATCEVTVTKSIESLRFNPSFTTIDLKEGNTYRLNLESVPVDIDPSLLAFEISDKSMISLNTKTMTITVSGHGNATITVRSKEDSDISAKMSIYVLDTSKEEEKPTPKVTNKDAEIDTKDIVDKVDELPNTKVDTSFFDIDIKNVLLMIIVIAIILVVLFVVISEIINRNRDKLGRFFGFRENFREDDYSPNHSDLDDYEDLDKMHLRTTKNVYKITYQTEKSANELKERLEREYQERIKIQESQKTKEQADAELLYFDQQMEKERGEEISEMLRADGLLDDSKEIIDTRETEELSDDFSEEDKEEFLKLSKDLEEDDDKFSTKDILSKDSKKTSENEFFSVEELRNELRDSLKDK